ncbi:uncharacterized protein LOC126996076 [Eriocheir sinensis]|uniref:uncharacterized protein LOC126996076 n=1 Tax=Eriocheir sinensis TaxID=95602 RepID=UPI0021C77401|nr:uncharacterized protein LOC126996076 [Eriocheir sinensis]
MLKVLPRKKFFKGSSRLLLPVTAALLMVMMATWSLETRREEETAGATGGGGGGLEVVEGLPGDDARAVDLLQRHWLQAPSVLPYNLNESPAYLSAANGDTWTFVHHYVTRLFEGQRGGFFVEAGALDGQMLSNSLWLERELGWTGLLVEPDPVSYSRLVTKHRKAWTSNTCLSHTGVTKASVHVSLTLPAGYRARPWYMKGSSYEIGFSLNSPSISNYVNAADKSYSVVSCFPLVSYLRALNVSTIDFLSLDTQGSEMEILKTIPWDEVNVRAVVVEIIGSRTGARFVGYMKSLGFTLVGHFLDYIFVKEGDPSLDKLRSKDGWELVIMNPTEEEPEVTTTGKGQGGQ